MLKYTTHDTAQRYNIYFPFNMHEPVLKTMALCKSWYYQNLSLIPLRISLQISRCVSIDFSRWYQFIVDVVFLLFFFFHFVFYLGPLGMGNYRVIIKTMHVYCIYTTPNSNEPLNWNHINCMNICVITYVHRDRHISNLFSSHIHLIISYIYKYFTNINTPLRTY